MRHAREEAKRYQHKYIRTEHLLLALLNMGALENILPIFDTTCIHQAVAVMRCPTCSAEEQMELSASAKRAYQLAESYASSHRMQSRELLLGILESSQNVPRLLSSCGVNVSDLKQSLRSEVLDGKQ